MGSIEKIFSTAFGSVEDGFGLVFETIGTFVEAGFGSLGEIVK